MESKNARVVISVSEGRVEIEGSQEFVEKSLEGFKEHIEKSLARIAGAAPATPMFGGTPGGGAGFQADLGTNTKGLEGYENLFAVGEDGKVQILKNVSGDGTADKAVNVALLVAFAHKQLGVSAVPFDTVQQLCLAHACLDTSNFSKQMRGAKSYLIVSGTSKKYTLALTVPGIQKAKELATSLLAVE